MLPAADFLADTFAWTFEEGDGLEEALEGGGLEAEVEEDGLEDVAMGSSFKWEEDECLALAFSLHPELFT